MTSTTAAVLRDGTWTVLPGTRVVRFGVRSLGLLTVRGTLAIEHGTVTIAASRPIAATGRLDATSVGTGLSKRDEHLRSADFLDAAAHPTILIRAGRFEPDGDGWRVPAVLTVAGTEAPVTLHARATADRDAITVRISGEFDRSQTSMRAPRLMVGHRVRVEAELTLIPQ